MMKSCAQPNAGSNRHPEEATGERAMRQRLGGLFSAFRALVFISAGRAFFATSTIASANAFGSETCIHPTLSNLAPACGDRPRPHNSQENNNVQQALGLDEAVVSHAVGAGFEPQH